MVTDEQLAAYLAGEMLDDERTAFEAGPLDDATRRELRAQQRISAGLHALFADDNDRLAQAILTTTRGISNEAIARRIATTHIAASPPPRAVPVRRPVQAKSRVVRRTAPVASPSRSAGRGWAWTLTFAVIAIAFIVWQLPRKASPSLIVATLTRAADAVWADTAFAPQPGHKLTAGSLRLKSGAVEIEFARGARAVIEGPAELQLVSDNEGRLASGKLWARVPPSAHGFTVRGRGFTAVDLGTEFGCNVPPSGAAEVHVFDGAVDVNSRRLRENQALELAATPREIPAQRSAFIGAEQMPQRTAFLRGSRTEQDIGNPGRRGSTTLDARTGVWTVAGGGADIFGTSDQFHFVSEEFAGDGAFIAKVSAVEKTDKYAKAGVMLRASMQPDAAYAMVFASPGAVAFEFRTATGADSSFDEFSIGGAPRWVKLVRRSDRIAAFHSADGVRWTELGKARTIPMPAPARAGLAVTAHDNAALNHSTFENVSTQP